MYPAILSVFSTHFENDAIALYNVLRQSGVEKCARIKILAIFFRIDHETYLDLERSGRRETKNLLCWFYPKVRKLGSNCLVYSSFGRSSDKFFSNL